MGKLKEVIALANNKGGVGKTTTVQNIAAGLVEQQKGAKVLVIDLDPQRNLSFLMGWDIAKSEAAGLPTVYNALREAQSLPVYQSVGEGGTIRKGQYYCPASKYLETVDNDLHHHMNSKLVLKKCFEQPLDNHTEDTSLRSVMDFDYIIIDCPPAMGELTYNALGVATQLIIPVQLEGMSYQGIGGVVRTYNRVKSDLNSTINLLGILKVMTSDRLNTAKGFSALLDEQFGEYVLKSHIRRSDKVNQSQTMRKSIFEYARWDNPGLDYSALVKEIISKI